MSKRFVLGIGAALVCALALPASGEVPLTNSGSAWAYSFSTQQISETTFRETSTSVYGSVYGDSGWAEVWRNVSLCEEVSEDAVQCFTESSSSGYANEATFTIGDQLDLEAAHLVADMWIETYDANWNPVGDPVFSHVVMDWTGTGSVDRDGGASVYSSGCFVAVDSYLGAHRSADASGSIGATSFPTTSEASIGSSSSIGTAQTC